MQGCVEPFPYSKSNALRELINYFNIKKIFLFLNLTLLVKSWTVSYLLNASCPSQFHLNSSLKKYFNICSTICHIYRSNKITLTYPYYIQTNPLVWISANRNRIESVRGRKSSGRALSLVIAQGAERIRGRIGITLTNYGNRRDPGRSGGPLELITLRCRT